MIYYAVKRITPFGTYTYGTFKTREEAQNTMISNGEYKIEEVDGVYNGSLKIKTETKKIEKE